MVSSSTDELVIERIVQKLLECAEAEGAPMDLSVMAMAIAFVSACRAGLQVDDEGISGLIRLVLEAPRET